MEIRTARSVARDSVQTDSQTIPHACMAWGESVRLLLQEREREKESNDRTNRGPENNANYSPLGLLDKASDF